MFLRSFKARSFRNLKPVEIEFEPSVNFFVGANGQGKTNLLEAIYVLANTKSFRSAPLADCLQHGQEALWLQGRVRSRGIDRELGLGWKGGIKELRVHDKGVSILGYLGNLDAWVMSFDQLPLVRGGPEERRKFLDRGIAQLKTSYLRTLAEFRHSLRQRNGLLLQIRAGTAAVAELQPWEEIYSRCALAVAAEREHYVQRLNQQLPQVQFSPDALRLKYIASARDPDVQSFCRTLASVRAEEIRHARTLRGPHRDEVKILLGDREIQRFGSGGQQRSAVFTLLFAAIQIYFVENNEYPLLLIDDLDAELDGNRLQALLEGLRSGRQVFISSSKETLLKSISYGKRWEVRQGSVWPVCSA